MDAHELERTVLMAQLDKKRALKEKYLRQTPQLPPDSPPVLLQGIQQQLSETAELFEDLVTLLDTLPEHTSPLSLFRRELEKLSALHAQERALYMGLPQELQNTSAGKKIRESVMLLGGAVSELSKMVLNMPNEQKAPLSDIIYLLKSAGTPV